MAINKHEKAAHAAAIAKVGQTSIESGEKLKSLEFLVIAVSKEEGAAIAQYARLCDETVAEIIRKSIIREATLADGYGSDDDQYEYCLRLPDSLSPEQQKKLVEEKYNKIRALLGWRPIKL